MSVDGNWTIVVDSPAGRQEAPFEFATEDGKVSGSCNYEGTLLEVLNGEMHGDRMTFNLKIKKPMPMKLTYILTVDGDTLAGELKPGIFPKQPVSGTRTEPRAH